MATLNIWNFVGLEEEKNEAKNKIKLIKNNLPVGEEEKNTSLDINVINFFLKDIEQKIYIA